MRGIKNVDFSNVITKPTLMERIEALQDQIRSNSVDGYEAFRKMRDLIWEQGEYDFEQEVKDHPHGVYVGLDNGDKALSWLKEHLKPEDYVAFPNSAIATYKACVHNVYFRKSSDAVLFKLAWIPEK